MYYLCLGSGLHGNWQLASQLTQRITQSLHVCTHAHMPGQAFNPDSTNVDMTLNVGTASYMVRVTIARLCSAISPRKPDISTD